MRWANSVFIISYKGEKLAYKLEYVQNTEVKTEQILNMNATTAL